MRLSLHLLDHERVKRVGPDVAARFFGILPQLAVGREHRIATNVTNDKGVVGVLRGEAHAHIRLSGAHQR